MRIKLRYERKYLVPNYFLDAIRKRLSGFVRPDIFTAPDTEGNPQYTVRSIYFDNSALGCYYEKGDGIMFRRKFRIRSYDSYEPHAKVVFEIKRKIENRIKKYRAFMCYDDIDDIFDTYDVEKYALKDRRYETSVDSAKRFFYHYIKYNFYPTVHVVYEREAYHGKFDPDTRITLDKNIRSRLYPKINDVFSNNNLKYLFKGHFILEIKYYRDTMPEWAHGIVKEFRLRHDALSKYTIGIDVNKDRVLQIY